MRRLNAAFAALRWLASFPTTTAWSQSGLFQGETKIIIQDDPLPTTSESGATLPADDQPAGTAVVPRVTLQAPIAPTTPPPPPPKTATTTAAAPVASNPALSRCAIVSGPNRNCIDAENKLPDASLVLKPDCKAASQQWIGEKGRLMTGWARATGPQCIRRVSQKSDAPQLVNCRAADAPTADQMWALRGAQIVGIDARCLQADGDRVRLGVCDPQNSAQTWIAMPIRRDLPARPRLSRPSARTAARAA